MAKLLVLLLTVFAAATAGPAAARAGAPRASAAAPPAGPTISTRSTRYGRILTDGRGRVLYLFTKDGRGASRCYKACAAAWPVRFAAGTPRAGRGVRQSLLGTVRRSGGRTQATYAGQPLYYYVGDTAEAQVTCQDVYEFGGTWLVLRGDGKAVR